MIQTLLSIYMVVLILIYVTIFRELILGILYVRKLRNFSPLSNENLPKISVIIPARNEAHTIRQALSSLLASQYPSLEIILINDRSEDQTGEIMKEMASEDSRLRVIQVRNLPPGWLGKNHALQKGAEVADGEYLIFTDADIHFSPDCLSRAVSLAKREDWDHLALGPEVVAPSLFLKSIIDAFAYFFVTGLRVRKVSDPNSNAFVGIGAFNLVKTAAFRQVGGMRLISLRPDDDVQLGKLLKRNGFRQEIVDGKGLIKVEWYPTVRAMMHGLEKNIYAGLDYSFGKFLLAIGFIYGVYLFPFFALFFASGWILFANVGIVFLLAVLIFWGFRSLDRSPATLPLFPFAVFMMSIIFINSVLKCLYRGGIEWRGSNYSLSQIRKNQI